MLWQERHSRETDVQEKLVEGAVRKAPQAPAVGRLSAILRLLAFSRLVSGSHQKMAEQE